MKRTLSAAALTFALATGSASGAKADGTYVYPNGGIKDYADAIAVPAPMPVPMKEATWYLRGDIGGSFVGSLDVDTDGNRHIATRDAGDIETSAFGEIGFGRFITSNVRADFTTSFHRTAQLTNDASQAYRDRLSDTIGGFNHVNHYRGTRRDDISINRQSTNMVNLYYDIQNGSRFTPYLGAGLGVTYQKIKQISVDTAICTRGTLNGFADACQATGGRNLGYVSSTTSERDEWLFTGALMAGFSYDINEYLTLDAGYRVLWMPGGVAVTAPDMERNSQIEWSNALLHQFRTGVRLNLY